MTVPGRCFACETPIWRVVTTTTGQEVILWPLPQSRYTVVQMPQGVSKGVGYCGGCCPAPGDPAHPAEVAVDPAAGPVLAVERAHERYAYWYSDDYGRFLRAWVGEETREDPARIVAEWERDRILAAGGA